MRWKKMNIEHPTSNAERRIAKSEIDNPPIIKYPIINTQFPMIRFAICTWTLIIPYWILIIRPFLWILLRVGHQNSAQT